MRKSTHWISLLITSAGIVWNAVWFGTLNPADPKDVISFISVMGTVLPGLYLIFSLISALNDALLRLRSTLEDVRKHDAAREMLDLLVNTSKVKGAKNDRNLHRRVLAELEDDNRRQLISNLPSVADFLERRGPALRVPEREPASEFVFRLADGLPMGSIWLATVKSSMGYGEIASPVFKRFNARILDRSRNGDICVGRLYYLPSSGTARHIIRRTPSTAREEELLCEISDSEARDILVKISGIDDVRAYNSDKKDFAMIWIPRRFSVLNAVRGTLSKSRVMEALETCKTASDLRGVFSGYQALCVVTWSILPPEDQSQIEFIEVMDFDESIAERYLCNYLTDWQNAHHVSRKLDDDLDSRRVARG